MSADELPEFGAMLPRRERQTKGWLWPILGVVAVALLTYVLLYYVPIFNRAEGYQAVFMTNGQVYFGRIARETSRDIYMSDVYYIQVQDQEQPATTEGGEPTRISVPTLLKRGGELHGPDGQLRLNRDHVIAIEHVGDQSQVMIQIRQLESQK